MFDFPAAPTLNQLFTPPGGPTYVWNGTAWRKAGGPTELALRAARNRIVNGAMQISQEWGNNAGGPVSTPSFYAADQWWSAAALTPGTVTIQRVQAVTPRGSRDRLRWTIGTARAALAAGDYLAIIHPIEGIRLVDFRYGSAVAKQSICRFGFKAPAGVYAVSIANATQNRAFISNFTITAGQANTDTEQVIIIPGDVTGAWLTDTGVGMYLRFVMGAGTNYQGVAGAWQAGAVFATAANTNGAATAGNVFELFDVGLYLDDQNTGVAPRWEMPDEAGELAACMRYFERGDGGIANTHWDAVEFKVNKRIAAAMTASPALSNIGAAITAFTFNNTSVLNYQWTANARM